MITAAQPGSPETGLNQGPGSGDGEMRINQTDTQLIKSTGCIDYLWKVRETHDAKGTTKFLLGKWAN